MSSISASNRRFAVTVWALLILAELARQNKTIILEIDPLVDDASVRRKGFYERCGYVANAFAHVHPPYQAANRGHELIVMKLSARDFSIGI